MQTSMYDISISLACHDSVQHPIQYWIIQYVLVLIAHKKGADDFGNFSELSHRECLRVSLRMNEGVLGFFLSHAHMQMVFDNIGMVF